MSRLKMLGILVGIAAALAVSAASASAEFKAIKQLKGPVTILKSGEFVGTSENEAATKFLFKCPASDIKAEWSIQTKGQIKDHMNQKTGKQIITKEGPQLHIQIKSWGPNCVMFVGGTTFKAGEVKISQCDLHIVQIQKFVGTAGFASECRIKVPTCEIIIPAGMETASESGQGVNVGLKETKFENIGENQIGLDNVKGILAQKQVNALCPLTTNQKVEILNVEYEVLGVNT